MRKFSKDEQIVIRQMVVHTKSPNPFLPINLFNDIFQIGTIGYDAKASTLFFADVNGKHQTYEQMMFIYNVILERVMLIEYLQKEGLIYIIPMATTTNTIYEAGTVKGPNVAMAVTPSINGFLLRCMNEPLYVGETLRALVENDFNSLEELSLEESKKQTWWSIAAVVLAIIALIIGLFQNCGGKNGYAPVADDSTNIVVPINAMLNYMQNNLDAKLDATMNNTAEIKAKLSDSLMIKNPCSCKSKAKPQVKPRIDNCEKYLRVNTCNDTVVSKDNFQ